MKKTFASFEKFKNGKYILLVLTFVVSFLGAYFSFSRCIRNINQKPVQLIQIIKKPTKLENNPQVATQIKDLGNGWKLYTNETLGFRLEYPSDWFDPYSKFKIKNYSTGEFDSNVVVTRFQNNVAITDPGFDFVVEIITNEKNVDLNTACAILYPNETSSEINFLRYSACGVKSFYKNTQDAESIVFLRKDKIVHIYGATSYIMNFEVHRNVYDKILKTFELI
jgi:hypothetical protein